jgi:benzoate membrane transport protein
MIFEDAPGIKEGFNDLKEYFNISTFGAGLIAAIFGCTGPPLIIIKGAMNAGLNEATITSWLFSIYFFGGLITLLIALMYKQPICGAWSIPGAILVAGVLSNFNINQAVGAYLISGLLVLILGLTGLVGKVIRWLPLPIVMGMIAGALFKFGTNIVMAFEEGPLLIGVSFVIYLIFSKLFPKIPGVVGALLVGLLLTIVTGTADFSQVSFEIVSPQFFVPEFSVDAIFSISIPLAIMVIGAENAQAAGVLMAEDYKPPINAMTILSGIGGIITSFFGGHNANIAGPMTAITSGPDAGEVKEGRYVASVFDGILFTGFGLLAGAATAIVTAIPSSLINLLAGLAMIGVLTNAFETAFSGKFQLGAFFALIIAASGISILKIGAPFWALAVGIIVSLLLERDDFKRNKETGETLA